jgi:hypothetical protein
MYVRDRATSRNKIKIKEFEPIYNITIYNLSPYIIRYLRSTHNNRFYTLYVIGPRSITHPFGVIGLNAHTK